MPAGTALVPAAGDRLRFRPFESGDQAALQAMHRDPRVRALLIDDHPLDEPAVARQFLRGVQRFCADHPGLGLWWTERRLPPEPTLLAEALAARDAGEIDAAALHWLEAPTWAFCGWFNLMPMPHDPARIEIGCRLRPEAWGQGLAEHGGELLLAHAFEVLALDEVWGVCHPRHRAVHAVLLTLGFEAAGVLPYGDLPPASHFRLHRTAWRAGLGQPLRQRRRRAQRALQALHEAPAHNRPGADPGLSPTARSVELRSMLESGSVAP
jgi:RimJ/RimL family protein N-acetyltransferase